MSTVPSCPTRNAETWPGLFPDRNQYLVLQAALGDGGVAIGAYRQWISSLDISKEFDREVFRLIPLLYDNLRRLGHRDHLTNRLKGTYRMAWAKNHRVFEETRPILEAFLGNGLDVMAIKGAPIALRYYRNMAVRPMADVDLVVPTDKAETAAKLLVDMDFSPWRPFDAHAKRYRHAMAFYGPAHREFDLHWRFLFEFCDVKADDFFRDSAVPFQFLGHDIVTLDATRSLVHTILHGLKWNIEPPIRWVPDSVMILRAERDVIDWEALIAFAVSNRVSRRLYLGLSYIASEFGAQVPDFVLKRLGERRRRLVEIVENGIILRPIDYETAFGPLVDAMADYPGLRTISGPVGLLVDLSHFLRYHWQLGGRREIPIRLIEGVLRRSRRIVRGSRRRLT